MATLLETLMMFTGSSLLNAYREAIRAKLRDVGAASSRPRAIDNRPYPARTTPDTAQPAIRAKLRDVGAATSRPRAIDNRPYPTRTMPDTAQRAWDGSGPAALKNTPLTEPRGRDTMNAEGADLTARPSIIALSNRHTLAGGGYFSLSSFNTNTSVANAIISTSASKTVKSLTPSRVAWQTVTPELPFREAHYTQTFAKSQQKELTSAGGHDMIPTATLGAEAPVTARFGRGAATSLSYCSAQASMPQKQAEGSRFERLPFAVEPMDYDEILYHIEQRLGAAIAYSAEGV